VKIDSKSLKSTKTEILIQPNTGPVKLKGIAAIVNKVVQQHGSDQGDLIQILLDIQKSFGWIPQEMLSEISRQLGVPYSQVYQIATFYKAFSLSPKGKHIIKVCKGTSCTVRGAQNIQDSLERQLGIGRDETTTNGNFSLETVNCVGCCALGPMMTIDEDYHGKLEMKALEGILAKYK
jgi:NADH-quinone oxidoreductase subunit E